MDDSGIRQRDPFASAVESDMRRRVFEHAAALLASLDLLYFAIIGLTTVQPLPTLVLAVLFPLINVPLMRASLKYDKPFVAWSLSFTILPMYGVTFVGGPQCPAWLMGFSAIAACIVTIQNKTHRLFNIIGFILAASLGSAASDRPTSEVFTVAITLLAFAVITARLHGFLAQQLKLISVSNRALSQFAGAAAHDLRAPLRKIRSWSRLALDERASGNDEKLDQLLSNIRRSARQTEELVGTLFDFAALPQQQLPTSTVPLESIVHEVLNELEVLLVETQTKVTVSPLPVVQGVAPLLKQVFQNFISNAVKYGDPKRNVEIKIFASPVQENGRVRVHVSDNGIGIGKSEQERIFEPFVRLGTPGKIPGAGIGLATVHRIAAIHGSKIEVESEVGRGTSFSLDFSLAQSTPSTQEPSRKTSEDRKTIPPTSTAPPDPPAEADSPKYKVLYVDDDRDEFELFETRLTRSGLPIELRSVDSATQALQLLCEEKFDLVLSDYNLAQTTGDDLLVKAKRCSPSTRCILTSSVAPLDLAAMLENNMFDCFYPKVIRPEQLWAELEKSSEKAA